MSSGGGHLNNDHISGGKIDALERMLFAPRGDWTESTSKRKEWKKEDERKTASHLGRADKADE